MSSTKQTEYHNYYLLDFLSLSLIDFPSILHKHIILAYRLQSYRATELQSYRATDVLNIQRGSFH